MIGADRTNNIDLIVARAEEFMRSGLGPAPKVKVTK
jgi:hypothetical protein